MANANYLDFELKILRQDGRYVVQVLHSPAGPARCDFERSLSDVEVENLLLKLARIRTTTRGIDSPELAAARKLGAELFKATFRDTVRDCYRTSLAKAQPPEYGGLRLKLRLQDVPELAVLPWEYLFDPDAGRFLARSVSTPIVRCLEVPENVPAFTTTLPLRMLGIVASPRDYARIDVKREHKLLREALAPLIRSRQLEIEWLERPTLAALRRKLRNKHYHMLHFIGHGGFDERTQQGVLVFEDAKSQAAAVPAETLSVLLHDHHSLRLVVLNACEGARSSSSDPFAGVATTFVHQGIPAVVAMQFVISDTAALAFAEEFYTALADGLPVDTAVAEARKAILTANNEVEWGTPVLFLRTANGRLFDFQFSDQGQQGAAKGTSARQEQTAEAPAEKTKCDVRAADAFPPPEREEQPISAPQAARTDEGRQRQLAELWRNALMSFYARDWAAAIRDLQAVLKLDSTYKDAAAKLAKARQEQRLSSLYAAALQARDAGDLNAAAGALQELVTEDKAYKDAAALLEDIRRAAVLAARYDDARTLAVAEQWHAVLEVFEEIAVLNPEYPDPEQLRATAKARMAEQLRQNELEDLLAQALDCFEAEDWQGAQVRLIRIQEIEPNYMGSAQLLLRADEELDSVRPLDDAAQEQERRGDRSLTETTHTSVAGALVLKPGEHLGPVGSVAFSPDGKLIAVGSQDKTVRLLDATTAAILRTFKGHHDEVSSVAFDPAGKVIASGGSDKTVRLWDATTGTALRIFEGHESPVNSVAFSPDGEVIASGGEDKTVRLWDATTGAALRTLIGHDDWVKSVAFSPDGKLIVSGGSDKTVRLWDATTGATLRILKGHHDGVSSVAFSPDGKVIASGSGDNTVRLWDAATGATLRTLKGPDDRVISVAFSPDGKLICSGGSDKTVRLWDASAGVVLRTFKGHDDWVNSIAFSPDGKLIVSGSSDKAVRLWDAATATTLSTLKGYNDVVLSVAVSPDGKVIASGGSDKTMRLWNVSAGTVLRTLETYGNWVFSVAFSPDGKLIASGISFTVRLWDATTGAALPTLESYADDVVLSVAFSPDSKVIASGGTNKTVRLWNATTGAALRTLKGHDDTVLSVAFSPDGKVIASGGSDKTVRLWDASAGAVLRIFTRGDIRTLKGHESPVNSVAFSPDGKVIASGSEDKTVRLWDTTTGAALRTLIGHDDWVKSVAFSPDGKVIASGSGDKTVRLWDAATGATLRTFEGHEGAVYSVAFSPDGKVIASGSDDNTVRLWRVNAG